jgi:ubiquinone/menaquinone biosynthesis C-methylase UbiE
VLKKEFWEKRHKESVGRYNRVTDFARFCYYNFLKEKKGKLLDLCCGKGADSIFYHNKGFNVTSLDYSSEAIKQFNETQNRYNIFIANLVHDISKKLPFEDSSFDYVYIRLGLHYFTDKELKNILSKIKRVLKSEGLLMFQVKSTSDKDYGKGKEIEKDMYEDETGYVRHFFSKEYAESLLEEFNIVMIEERKIPNGSAYLEVVVEKK